MTSRIVPFGLRMPPDLRDVVRAAADANGRSMNAEICHRLLSEGRDPAENETMGKSQTLTIRLSEDTRDKLDRMSNRGPYKISLTSIVERGIELAAQELEDLNRKGGA